MPEGSCEAPLPNDGRLPPDGSLLDGVRDGVEGTRPALGREAPVEGLWAGRVAAPVDGREELPADGRDDEPPEGRE
ncbi:MAG: hypothetical protein V4689_02900 [Verrucomicrobiota bacterium]